MAALSKEEDSKRIKLQMQVDELVKQNDQQAVTSDVAFRCRVPMEFPSHRILNGMYRGTQTDSLSRWYTNSGCRG
jgi:hypothetical protein